MVPPVVKQKLIAQNKPSVVVWTTVIKQNVRDSAVTNLVAVD
jgi:hypothetical protein